MATLQEKMPKTFNNIICYLYSISKTLPPYSELLQIEDDARNVVKEKHEQKKHGFRDRTTFHCHAAECIVLSMTSALMDSAPAGSTPWHSSDREGIYTNSLNVTVEAMTLLEAQHSVIPLEGTYPFSSEESNVSQDHLLW